MSGIIKLCIGILVVCVILRAIKYRTEIGEMPDFAETIFNGTKSAFYFLLAWYIYTVLKKMQFPKIDVLTFLTFLLACFEAAHNFMNSLGNWLAFMIGNFILPKSEY